MELNSNNLIKYNKLKNNIKSIRNNLKWSNFIKD